MRRLETYDWWPDLVALKDELSLRELAERFNVTPGAISAAFKRTNTQRRPAPPGPRALRKRRSKLPPEPGEARSGEPSSGKPATPPKARPGSKDPQILAHYDLLGEVPDAEVAQRADVSVRTIASFRARHDIPAYSGPRRGADATPARGSRIDPFRELLGQVPDRVVAEKAGVSLNAVRNYRVKHEIPAAQRPARRTAESGYSKRYSAPSGDSAWRVRFEAEDGPSYRVIIASSVVDAAALAHVAKLGHVTEIVWVGEIL